jgi:hypothetical protein
MAMIHHEPHPAFDSPATQVFALEGRLSSCMAENAALHEQAMRLRLTDEERAAIEDAAHLCESSPYPLTQKDGATLRNLLRRKTL